MRDEKNKLMLRGAVLLMLILVIVLGSGASAQPVVPPGFKAEVFAEVTYPVMLSFDSDGNLYAGRNHISHGGLKERIHRISADGLIVEEFGQKIRDPDAVIADVGGRVATEPGSVLVGGEIGGPHRGRITQIDPDGNNTVLFQSDGTDNSLGNVSEFAFDSRGRLLILNGLVPKGGGSSVGVIDNGQLGLLFESQPGEHHTGFAIDQSDRIWVITGDGVIKIYNSDGTLQDNGFVDLPSSGGSIRFDSQGLLGGGLFVQTGTTEWGAIFRLDLANRTATEFATGFTKIWGIAFGPDGSLFISEQHASRVWRVFRDNLPPVAACQDMTVAAGSDCTADASIDNGSYDPDGDPTTLEQTPAGPYPLGDTLVTLTVTDDKGASDECTATVTVVDADPPTIVLSEPYPSVLWPVNHKFVDVVIMGVALDNCCTDLATHVSVDVFDVDGGDGGPKHDPDFKIIGAEIDDDGNIEIMVSLRAERSGKGDGRIYEISVEVTDGSGNMADATAYVVVPHDQDKAKK